MKVTMSQIASVVGVSRGTVDRALHHRSGVNPQVADEILKVAHELGYRPNFSARTLSGAHKRLRLGYVLPEATGFWSDVMAGIELARQELTDCGVDIIVSRFVNYTFEDQSHCIDAVMSKQVDGLAVVPINDAGIKARLAQITAGGTPVVLVNSELIGIEDVGALCYIGSDYMFSGRTAAGMLRLCHHAPAIELAVFSGSNNMLSQSTRITGFLQEIDRMGLNCHLIDILNTARFSRKETNPPDAYQIARAFLQEHPETTAVFTAGGSSMKVARAIYDCGRAGEIVHITFDLNAGTQAYLKNGSITVIIGQESIVQGYRPLKLLFDYIVNRIEPQDRRIILHNEIIIPQNAVRPDGQ